MIRLIILFGIMVALLFGSCSLFCKGNKNSSKVAAQEAKTDTVRSDSTNPSPQQVGEAPKHKAPNQEEIDKQKEELLKEKRKNRQPDQ